MIRYRLPSWERYVTTWIHYADSGTEGLYITKPAEVDVLIKKHPKLKALKFEFNKTAFKKSFDYTSYIDEWLTKHQTELLSIGRGHTMTNLPRSIHLQSIKYLKLDLEEIREIDYHFEHLTDLEELSVSTKYPLKLGSHFQGLDQLEKLHLKAASISDLSQIWGLKKLKQLDLVITDHDRISEDIYNLSQLVKLTFEISNLSHLPNSSSRLPNLQSLNILVPKTLRSIPSSLFNETIQNLSIHAQRVHPSLQFPDVLSLPNLESLTIVNIEASPFPLISIPNAKTITLKVKNEEVLSHLQDAVTVKKLYVNAPSVGSMSKLNHPNLEEYRGRLSSSDGEIDIRHWENLRTLGVTDSDLTDVDLILPNGIESLSIENSAVAPILDKLPDHIKNLKLNNALGLKQIKLSSDLRILNRLQISNCPELESIQFTQATALPIQSISIVGCKSFSDVPTEILLCPMLRNLKLSNNKIIYPKEKLASLGTILKFLATSDTTDTERLALAHWILQADESDHLPTMIRKATFNLLRHKNKEIYQLINSNLASINPEKKAFIDLELNQIKDKQIAIVGKPFNTLTAIKEEAKVLGLTLTTDLEKADFILLGIKAEFNETPNSKTYIVSERELNQKSKEVSPKFLTSPNTSQKVKNNLRQILWSVNPSTENMALEMMKKGGMPSDVIGECIAIAKTSVDKSVKGKYRRFLKSKLSSEEFNLITKNVSFSRKQNPFWKLSYEFPNQLLGRLAVALYKRTGSYYSEVLNYHHADYDIRSEIISNEIIPAVLSRPHYLQLRYRLTYEELGSILSLPELQGKLKRLIFSVSSDKVPKVIANHISLKELEIVGQNEFSEFPPEIYSLKRLSILKLNSVNHLDIDERISNLKQLKQVFINSETNVRIHESINALPKIDRVYCSNGVEYYR